MEDIHRHGRDEDREIKTECADQKEHDYERSEVRPSPYVVESFDEATWRTGSPRVCPEFLDAQQIHGE
jgi:hypothetical protein